MIKVRFSTYEDAHQLAHRLREADRNEVLAAGSESPLEALLSGVRFSSICLTVEEDGHPQVMMGVVPLSSTEGSIWLLASDFIDRHPVVFLKRAKDWLKFFHSFYPTLSNAVDARNAVHIRWLRWMGFSITPTTCPSPCGYPFHPFTRTEHV